MNLFRINKISFVILLAAFFSCTEAYELKTENFESLLVVEATITDEFKTQEIKLSKTYRLESDEPNEVSNAQVWVETTSGIQYNFSQSEPGLYRSQNAFQAQTSEDYTLHVILSDGSSYVSTTELLPPPTEIESLDASLETYDGVLGVQVFANSLNNGNGATYFKYEYEETYKIVVPFYSFVDLIPINVDQTNDLIYELELIPKTEDVRTCYSSNKSIDIIQTSLNDSQNSSVDRFPVHFINADNGILRDRYSILVTQFVQSVEAYNFYKILKELGTVENLFTSNQPGFIQGNMNSTVNETENVIGFFQVSSVSSKRIFFSFSDFDIPRPAYLYECRYYVDLDYNDATALDGDRNDYALIYNLLIGNKFKYLEGTHPKYTFINAECTDCTSVSSLIIPEFWED